MSRPTYTVVQLTQRYRRINDAWYREAIARRSDGALRVIALPESSAA